MALYLNGKQLLNSLVIDGDTSGSAFTPVFTETLLVDNSTGASSFTLSEDYHNYDFVKVSLLNYNASPNRTTVIITTPTVIDKCFNLGNLINFNERGNNEYACYRKSGLTWTRNNNRDCVVNYIWGMECTNATVSETAIYTASSVSGSNRVITYNDGDLFDFDLIFFAANSNSSDEVQPCYFYFSPGIDIQNRLPYVLNQYNANHTVEISPHSISSAPYACAVGINFES